ncbi:MAG: 2-octaprenyl-6-methoxyphenyl hydroxylase [Aquabacterium sp.]|nr:MAG: 2-octaprenyl-6-methoxyphenyl hydroxylase [Aquabacterium sp.]
MTVAHPHIAIIGAGPAGLALALHAAQALPQSRITLFDARPAERDVSADPRTLALSLGSVQALQRLGVWDRIVQGGRVQPIHEVHVSQQQPALLSRLLPERLRPGGPDGEPEVLIRAVDEAVPQLGAVLSYGAIVAPLQAAWMELIAHEQTLRGDQPPRLVTRFGTKVGGFKPVAGGVEVDADIAETFDLAVVAEGGVFADQPAKTWTQGLSHDYRQTAWVGQVGIEGGRFGVAWERFTPHGPAALLPLAPQPGDDAGGARAALVWCVPREDDPVAALDEAQRLALLNTVFHPKVGRILSLSPLKAFPLGLNAEWRLAQSRVVRIGNAAQTLHPVAGQGLNLGLRDVHALVDALSHTRPDGTPPELDAAIRRFELRRTPDRWALIGATDFLARSFTWPVPALATVRGLGLAALQAVGPVKSRLARGMMFGLR